MIVDKTWKLTNTVMVGLYDRSSHTQRQTTFEDNVSHSQISHPYHPGNLVRYGVVATRSSRQEEVRHNTLLM